MSNDNNSVNIDLTDLGDGKELTTGAEVIVQVGAAKFADSKANNKMLKMTLNVVSLIGAGETIWHQLMLVNPTNKSQTLQWLKRAQRDLDKMLGYKVDAINDNLLKELAGSAFRAKIKIDVSDEYGAQIRISSVIGPVSADEIEAEMQDFELDIDGVGDLGELAF